MKQEKICIGLPFWHPNSYILRCESKVTKLSLLQWPIWKKLRSELHYPTVTSKITSLRFLSFEIFKAFKFFYDIQISLCDQSKMFLSIHGTMTWLPRLPLKQSPCVLNYDQNRDSIWFMLIIVWFFHFCGILIRSNYISMIHESEVRTYVEQWQVQWHNIQGIQIMIQYE